MWHVCQKEWQMHPRFQTPPRRKPRLYISKNLRLSRYCFIMLCNKDIKELFSVTSYHKHQYYFPCRANTLDKQLGKSNTVVSRPDSSRKHQQRCKVSSDTCSRGQGKPWWPSPAGTVPQGLGITGIPQPHRIHQWPWTRQARNQMQSPPGERSWEP